MSRNWISALVLVCVLGGGYRLAMAQQSGGAFVPTFNYAISGLWNWTHPCTGGGNLVGSNNCGAFQINGTSVYQVTTAGVVMLDGSNPTSVDMNPLTTIDGCAVVLGGSTAPGADPTAVSANVNATAGQLDIYAWKPTAAGDTALIASTSNRLVIYHCAGR